MTLRELKDAACKAVTEGDYVHGVELYRALVLMAPHDVMIRRNYADVLRKRGRSLEAVDEYMTTARLYAAVREMNKAIAIARLVLQLDGRHVEAQQSIYEWRRLPLRRNAVTLREAG